MSYDNYYMVADALCVDFCSICILYFTKCLNCYICLQVSEGIDFSDDNARVVVSFFLFKFSGPRVLLFNLHNFGLGL